MSRILLIGHLPPPFLADQKVEAAHYRTWQFLDPLLADQHEICLCAGSADAANSQQPPAIPEGGLPANLSVQAVPFGRLGWARGLQKAHDSFSPDCIVAVNFDRCLSATKLRTDKPIWMDIYGDYLTIIQVARYRAGDGRGIPTSIAFMRQVLRRGDKFSGCGGPQKHALTGELAMAGRLNHRTFGYPFVETILPGAPPANGVVPTAKTPRYLAEFGIDHDAFVVLWCGGYNTWTDVDTLFAGLEMAMSQEPTLHFVSVGASTYQDPENVYTRLNQMIERSPHQARYHMLGWRPWAEIPQFYRESHVGLNIDAPHYETIYGTRTRLVEMISAGLPVVTTLGSELSYLLEAQKAGITFQDGDSLALGQHLLNLSRNPDRLQELSKAAQRTAHTDLSFAKTMEPLRAWAANPQPAPDRAEPGLGAWLKRKEFQARALLRLLLWHLAGLEK